MASTNHQQSLVKWALKIYKKIFKKFLQYFYIKKTFFPITLELDCSHNKGPL